MLHIHTLFDRFLHLNNDFSQKSLWPRLSHPKNFVSLKERGFGRQERHALLINPSPVKRSLFFAFN